MANFFKDNKSQIKKLLEARSVNINSQNTTGDSVRKALNVSNSYTARVRSEAPMDLSGSQYSSILETGKKVFNDYRADDIRARRFNSNIIAFDEYGTDEEKNTAYYLLGQEVLNGGSGTGYIDVLKNNFNRDKYLKPTEDFINQFGRDIQDRRIEGVREDLTINEGDSWLTQAGKRIGGFGLGVSNQFASGIQSARDILSGLSGNNDENNGGWDRSYESSQMAGVGSEALSQGGGEVGQFFGDTVIGLGSNALSMAMGGRYSNIFMGLNAAASAAEDAKQRGGSEGQQFLNGVLQGITEVAAERIPVNKFFDLFDNLGKQSGKQIIKNMLTQAGAEATEEGLTELVNAVTDRLVMQEKSNYDTIRNELIAAGSEDPDKEALIQVGTNILKAAGQGGLSGLFFGAIGEAGAYNNTRQYGSQFNGDIDTVQSIIDSGLESTDGSRSRALAENAQTRLNENGSLSDYQLGTLQIETQRQIEQEGLTQARENNYTIEQIAADEGLRQVILEMKKGELNRLVGNNRQASELLSAAKKADKANLNTPLDVSIPNPDAPVVATPSVATSDTQNTFSMSPEQVQSRSAELNNRPDSLVAKAESSDNPSNNENILFQDYKTRSVWDTLANKEVQIIDNELRELIRNDSDNTYKSLPNVELIQSARTELESNQEQAMTSWFARFAGKDYSATPDDIAMGTLMLAYFNEHKMYDQAVNVVRTLEEAGTKAGQTVQAFYLLQRLTPEGMLRYVTKNLDGLVENAQKGKGISKKQLDQLKNNLTLSKEDIEFIYEQTNIMNTVQTEQAKREAFARIEQRINSKIPKSLSEKVRTWMRISMLLNPKTLLRNVVGNAAMSPVYVVDNIFASATDLVISKIKGTEFTNSVSLKGTAAFAKHFAEGAKGSIRDFRTGLDTRNYEGRYDASTRRNNRAFEGSNNIAGKAVNFLDRLLSFGLDIGDATFFNGHYMESITNQMLSAGLDPDVDAPTQVMVENAKQLALERTWQDSNQVTKAFSKLKETLNKIPIGLKTPLSGNQRYGLGDMIIPFTTTPANLVRAIYRYSPAALIGTIVGDGKRLSNAMSNYGVDSDQAKAAQFRFSKNFGSAVSGTLIFVIAKVLVDLGLAVGGVDEDKDVSAFMQNILGKKPYSINILGQSFTYDWAQPLGTILAITSDMSDVKDGADFFESIASAVSSGTNTLFDLSLFSGIQEIFAGENPIQVLGDKLLGELSKTVPTFVGQIARAADDTERITFDKNPLVNAYNQLLAKIPGLRTTLEARVDVLGRDVEAYNDLFNVFLNPANTSPTNPTKESEYLYNLYTETGDKTIIPPVAPYYFMYEGEKINLSGKDRTLYQQTTGKLISEQVGGLIDNSIYNDLDTETQASIINSLYQYANAKAKATIYDEYAMSTANEKVKKAEAKGIDPYMYLLVKKNSDKDGNGSVSQEEMEEALNRSKLTRSQKAYMWMLQNSKWKENPYQ